MTDVAPSKCSKCGKPHAGCTAHTRSGNPCRNQPMTAQRVCRMHGGAAPRAREKARRRVALEKATADKLALIGHAPGTGVVDPLMVLAELAAESLAMKDALAARVNALKSLRFTDDKRSEQLRSEVVLYERALDRSAKFVEMLAKSGFEEARVRLQQQQGLLVAHVMKRVLDQLELSQHQQGIARQVIPIELRRLDGTEESK